jgi:quercetin dioxygenase-like cupin family protein
MDNQNIAVSPATDPESSGRSTSVKLTVQEAGGSAMMFEETVPSGRQSTSFHRHRDSDELAYVLSGEITFRIDEQVVVRGAGGCAFMPRRVPHAWKNTGADEARVLFLYTPGIAGGLIEEQQRTGRKFASMNEAELAEILRRHGWELFGPSPL